MLRFGLIIVVFILLAIYIFRLSWEGKISGSFRTVSLVLVGLLIVLTGVGLYYNVTQYSVQTVQEEFSERRAEILDRIEGHLKRQEYTRARELAATYHPQIQDRRLDRLYRESRKKELLEQAEKVDPSNHQALLAIYSQLAELTREAAYRQKAAQQREKLRDQKEQALLEQVRALDADALGRRLLGYRRLMELNPEQPQYKQQYESLLRRKDDLLQNTPWSDICDSASLDECAHIGYLARAAEGMGQQDAGRKRILGEILGISQRSKGTRISRDGTVAPEDGLYYIVSNGTDIELVKTAFIEAADPFE